MRLGLGLGVDARNIAALSGGLRARFLGTGTQYTQLAPITRQLTAAMSGDGTQISELLVTKRFAPNYTGDGTLAASLDSFTGILDTVPNASFAGAIMLLKSDYAGGLIRVIAYNGTTQFGAADIMPIAVGDQFAVTLNSTIANLDATASGRGLTTSSTLGDLCSVGVNNYDGLVTRFYDQSGNNNYAEQTTISLMKKIVIAGILNVEGSFAALDGLNYPLQSAIDLTDFTAVWVSKKSSTIGTGSVVLGHTTNGDVYGGDDVDNAGNPYMRNNTGTLIATANGNSAAASGNETTYHIAGIKRVGSDCNSIFNAANSSTVARNSTTTTVNKLGYTNSFASYNYVGNIQVEIIWPSSEDLSAIKTIINTSLSIY